MPIYDYRCQNGHTFEAMQSISDPVLTSCTICGATVQRVLHPPAVHFKGSGFYNTDYGTRRREREKAASGDGGEAKKADGAATKDGAKAPAGGGEKAAASKPAD
jgi:putative FmdB family regulatory protein